MPAPLAKGIILLSSILVAAGIAAYENPEIRAWIEERRRRIALKFDEFNGGPSQRRRFSNDDISIREDNSAEAEARRSRARQEIMERGIELERRRRAAQERRTTTSSFDDMVDSGGKLKEEDGNTTATSVQDQSSHADIRRRTAQSQAIAQGSIMANPFADESGGIFEERATLERESEGPHHIKSEQGTSLQIDTSQPVLSTSAADDLVQLTPTTSVAASTLLSASGAMTPTSTQHPHLTPQEPTNRTTQSPAQSYQSIQEWASAAASSRPEPFYSPPESERNYQHIDANVQTPSKASSMTASVIGTNDVASEAGDFGVDALSESGVHTPLTWSEIGSQISED